MSGVSQVADPDEGNDFTVDFTDASNPDITLKTGDGNWIVYAEVVSTGNPANIGDLKIDATVTTDDFEVTIQNGTDEGGVDVHDIYLKDDTNWTGHSKLESGSEISGDLTGNLTVVRSSGAGGQLYFTIGDDARGSINVYDVKYLDVGDDLTSQGLETEKITGTLTVNGDLLSDLDVNVKIDGGTVDVYHAVGPFAEITIADMASATVQFGGDGDLGQHDFAGDITLLTGVPYNSTVRIWGSLTSVSSVDLTDQDVAGELELAGGSGSVANGGAVTGLVWLAEDAAASQDPNTFSGTAEFASVGGAGSIRTEAANLSGTLDISGDVDGSVILGAGQGTGAGHLLSKGQIAIGGNVAGFVRVSQDADGDIKVEGNISSSGAVQVNGDLKSKGRILIDGLCDGAITVGAETVALSLIRIIEGLEDDGSITINDDRGAYDANGTIYIGPATLPDWPFTTVFEGNIMIKDEGPPGVGGGDLEGTIEVVGCIDDEEEEDLDICICGTNNGTVKLTQDESCDYEVDWSCVTGCP